ncbi:hypothetical protein [Streptomyces sp. WMMC897]|uniref:hypothetical protein n=1 Tax=Streptomyces sp. WMMC897 TaxID=3014782 RepID=UPI0022B61A04|nr:hypothetical protein [Streptomyces sp. WMMC897]MCZ7412950.1 hypothetical protein [Streptomyces sp. WMMC897]
MVGLTERHFTAHRRSERAGGRGEFASLALGQDRDPGLLAPAQHQYLPKEGVDPQALGAVVTGR